MQKKKPFLIACIVSVFLLIPVIVIVATFYPFRQADNPKPPNAELEALNYEVDYTVYHYDLGEEYLKDAGFPNLTQSDNTITGNDYLSAGWQIIKSTDELAAFKALVGETLDACFVPPGHFSLFSGSVQNNDRAYLREFGKTVDIEWNDDFFANRRLLIVDLCSHCSPDLLAKPESLEMSGSTIRLDVRYDNSTGWVGSSAGAVLLISVPKECEYADVNIVHDCG